ncbi:putative aminotransferase [Gordonia spumicola]|uniref:Putative aminotransferase n=1 Tax=Gordonia spumicola TaxID=589161 RepID=A0A7I9V3U9_9ACTN|nr:DegT/DnrJ/EryC1/StrS family aminotransferase [Gordonia spumicola]GEE00105.1 putative aminotransferase [Gordonia spumicola]
MTDMIADSVVHDVAPMTVNGRATDLSLLADRVMHRLPPRPVMVLDVPGNEQLRALATRNPLWKRKEIVDVGGVVSSVPAAPLDRLLSAEEIAPIERAIHDVLVTGRFESGPWVADFEHSLAGFLGAAGAIGTSSGADALIAALRAVGVRAGDEVIVPDSATGVENAVRRVGAVAVVVDTDDQDLLAPERVRAALTDRTRCVIPVHRYGRAADVRSISAVVDGLSVAIVEDAAEGIGLDGLGVWSDAVVIGFDPQKNLGSCGRSGAVLTYRSDVADLVRDLAADTRMDDVQAAALSARLPFLALNNLRRSILALRYLEWLAPLAETGVLTLPERVDNHVWNRFAVRQDPCRARHTAEILDQRGVDVTRDGDVLHLPMFPRLTITEQDHVVAALFSAARSER